MKIFTKKEAVELHGNEAQKEHFAKYGKFVSKRYEEGLLKTLDSIYYDIKIVKNPNGRGNAYQVGEEKEVYTLRQDGRISNGAYKVPYTKNLDVVVVSILEQGLETNTAQTLASWSKDFGVITEQMHDLLLSRYHDGLRQTYIEDLQNNSIIKLGEDRIVDDFAQTVKELTNQVAGTLERMKRLEIIEFYPVFKGHIAGIEKPINLHEDVYKQVVKLKRRMMEHYDVSEWYLTTYKNAKKSVEFNKDFKEQLAQVKDENGKVLGLDYYYTAYAIILKARKKKIIAYLEKFNKEAIEQFKKDEGSFLVENEYQFHSKRKKHIVEEAEKKVNKFLAPKPFKSANEEFGGKAVIKKPTINDYTYDESYYSLYFEGLYVKRIEELQDYYGYSFS